MADHFMKQPGKVLLLLTLVAVVVSTQIIRGNVPGGLGANGQHARPFYNVAHNPNAIEEATQALAVGANALEPDLMRFPDLAVWNASRLNPQAGPTGLYVYHDHVLAPSRKPDTVESYLDNLHALVKAGTNLALIVFDIKSAAAEYLGQDGGKKLREAVATHLNYDGVNVNIIYSVGETADSNFFMDNVCLGPREGLMIDGENDASGILNTLQNHITQSNLNAATNCSGNPVPYNMGFGNGSAGESLGFAPNVLLSIMQASWIRAGQPGIGNVAIPYAYPIAGVSRMNAYINAGADGLIPDRDIQPQSWPDTLLSLSVLSDLVTNRSDVYLATAADDPFHPPNEAYALRVDTADVATAGTDADLTFKLTGTCGSAQVTIDASYQGLFERGGRNYVTIQSKNLGKLQSLELSSDCSGVAPTWTPGTIQVSSARWGIPYSEDRHVDFNVEVCDGTASKSLDNWGRDCDTTPPSASPTQSPAANGSGWNNSNVTVNWNWSDNVGGSGVDPAACTTSSVSSGEGTLTLNATCKDLDGNSGSKSYVVKVDKTAPTITIGQPAATTYVHSATLTLDYAVVDGGSGVASVTPAMDGSFTVDGSSLPSGRAIDLLTSLQLGQHTFTVDATDNAGNASPQGSVTFTIVVTPASVIQGVNQLLANGAVEAQTANSLLTKLTNAMAKQSAGSCNIVSNMYSAFINEVMAQSGKSITPAAAATLIADAQYLIAHCP